MREGRIYTWSPLQYGFIIIGQDIFFLHGSEITQNADKAGVGAKVSFEVAPPLAGKKHPRAINAVIGGAL
jgi:'Cold-shock' DNA-binding domain